jgi:tetratricopeptide (TPR) repeat protein
MTSSAPAPTGMSNYPTIFRQFIVRSAAASLAVLREQQASATLSNEERDQALHNLTYVLHLSDTPEAWPVSSHLLLTMAPKMEQAGHRDDWIPFLEEGIRLSQAAGDRPAEAQLRLNLGILLQLHRKYEAARRELEASAALFAALGERQQEGRAVNRLAYVARLQNHTGEAARLAHTALALLPAGDPEQAYSESVLGAVAVDHHDWPEAIVRYQRSLALWEMQDDRRMIAWSLTNLASALRPAGRLAEAGECCRRAIAIFDAIDDPVHRAAAQVNLGNILLTDDQPAEALAFYLAAEPVLRSARDDLRLAKLYCNLGKAYRTLGQPEVAVVWSQASVDTYEKLGATQALINSLDGLGLAYACLGQATRARLTFLRALDLLPQVESQAVRNVFEPMLKEHLGDLASQE